MKHLALAAATMVLLGFGGARADDSPAWNDRTDSPGDFLLHARPDRVTPVPVGPAIRSEPRAAGERNGDVGAARRDAPLDPARRETGNNT